MTHKEKILEFVDFTGLTKTKFCKKCGLSNGYLDSKGAITSDKLVLILENFSELNLDWLFFNKGKMTISEETDIPILSEPPIKYLKNQKLKELSLLGLDAKIEGVINDIDVFKEELRKLVLEKVNEAMNNKNV